MKQFFYISKEFFHYMLIKAQTYFATNCSLHPHSQLHGGGAIEKESAKKKVWIKLWNELNTWTWFNTRQNYYWTRETRVVIFMMTYFMAYLVGWLIQTFHDCLSWMASHKSYFLGHGPELDYCKFHFFWSFFYLK